MEDLGSAMRVMGKHPSKIHLRQLIDLVNSGGDGMLNFEDFLRMMVLWNLKVSDFSVGCPRGGSD